MIRFKKKPIIIEALQWDGKNHREMFEFLGGGADSYITSKGKLIKDRRVPGGLVVKTLEGEHVARIGDWVIKGIKGEFYPCKPDIFEATYSKVEEMEEKQT